MNQKSFSSKINFTTVSDWFYSDYCNFKGREISENSALTINSIFVNRIKPFIGDKMLREVTDLDCQNIIIRQKDQNARHGTLFGTYSVLTRIFRSALLNYLITKENYPCKGLRMLTF